MPLIKENACWGCELHEQDAHGFVRPEGNGTLGVMIMGEAGGAHERATGLPFRPNAPAGSVLERAIRRAGFSRSQFRVMNTVNCFVGDTEVEARNIEVGYRRWYAGPMCRIKLKSGKDLTGTPNHPVLTQRGMVSLGQLQPSDYLISGTWQETMISANPDVKNRPAKFIELINALSIAGVCERAVGSNMDFHGDGIDSDIDVIATDWLLRNRIESTFFQHLIKRVLKSSYLRSGFLASLGSGDSTSLNNRRIALLAFDSFMRRMGDLLSVVWSHYCEAQTSGVGPIAHANVLRFEQAADSTFADSEPSGQGLKPFPIQIGEDQVIWVEWNDFSGHVYNLQTECGQYIANGYIVSNCTPPRDWLSGAPWEFGAIAHCEVHRRREIEKMKPRVILALGQTAFRTLTGHDGLKQTISIMRGYPIETEWGLVLGSYHPSFLVRGNMNLMGVLIHDIQKAVQIARQGWERKEVRYNMRPDRDAVEEFCADVRKNPKLPLAFDIETEHTSSITEEEFGDEEDHTPITSIQFSLRPGEGIFFPWMGEFQSVAKRVFELSREIVGHNSFRFDLPKLQVAGVHVNNIGYDTMEAFRHLQRDLTGHYNLQSVASFYGMDRPWKHLSDSEPEFYGCADVDAVQRIWAKLPEDLKKRGIW